MRVHLSAIVEAIRAELDQAQKGARVGKLDHEFVIRWVVESLCINEGMMIFYGNHSERVPSPITMLRVIWVRDQAWVQAWRSRLSPQRIPEDHMIRLQLDAHMDELPIDIAHDVGRERLIGWGFLLPPDGHLIGRCLRLFGSDFAACVETLTLPQLPPDALHTHRAKSVTKKSPYSLRQRFRPSCWISTPHWIWMVSRFVTTVHDAAFLLSLSWEIRERIAADILKGKLDPDTVEAILATTALSRV